MAAVEHRMRILHWPIQISVDFQWPAFIQRMFARTIEPFTVNEVRLHHIVHCEIGEPDSLIAVLEFNDFKADASDPEYVDLNQLDASLEKNGNYFIWTCSCGAPGCAGLNNGVDVSHKDENTYWHDIDGKRKFLFKTKDLQIAVSNGIIDGRSLLNDRPELEPAPKQNETAYKFDEQSR